MRKNIFPLAVLIAGLAIGASSGLYIKTLAFSSFALSGFRMGIPAVVLLPLMIKRNNLAGPRGFRKTLWVASGLNVVRMVLYVTAFKLTAVGNAIVLLYLWPVFSLILIAVRDRRPPKPWQVLTIIAAFTGVVIMNLHRDFSMGGTDLPGTLAMTASAFLFAAITLMFKSAMVKTDEAETLFFQNIAGAVVFLPFCFMEIPVTPLPHIGMGLIYGSSVGLLAFGCYYFALKRVPVFQYSAVSYLEVFFGLLYGTMLLSEELTLNMILGVLLVLGASFSAALKPFFSFKNQDHNEGESSKKSP